MMKFLSFAILFVCSLTSMANNQAVLISDNKRIEETWSWCFSENLGLNINKITSCYDCTLKAQKGMAEDVQRILSLKNLDQITPLVVFLQLGCNDKADSQDAFQSYEQTLFDYPYGKVCTAKGTNPKTKNIAISKDDAKISNSNFAGSLYRIVKSIRESVHGVRIFLLAPTRYNQHPTGDDSLKCQQLKTIANMFCIPYVEDFKTVTAYDFTWKGTRPHIGNILLLGDSYSELKKWTSRIERTTDATFVNLGKVSATLKERTTGTTNTLGAQLSRIPANCKPDIILIEGGINDEADQPRFVEKYEECIQNNRRTTFAGALAYIVNNLRKRFPKAKIYAITPGGLYYGHTDKPFEFITKSDQIRKAAKLIGIQTINWDREGCLSFVFNNSKGTGNGTASKPFLYNVPSRETGDLLHPNNYGAAFLAENVIKELR